MVGAINANGSTDIRTQISLAKEADYMLLPGEPFPDEAINSMSSMAHTATTATVTAAPTSGNAAGASQSSGAAGGASSNDNSGGGLSGGAIAGIVIGAVAGLAILAALFFLLGRTKSMKKRLDQREADNNPNNNDPNRQSQMTGGTPSWMPPPHANQYFNPNNPHASAQLPPYDPHQHPYYEQKPPDETASLASGPMTPPLRGSSPPIPNMGGHPMPGFQPLDQRGSGYGNQQGFVPPSELSGSEGMAAELYTPGKDHTAGEGHPAYK